ncbi:hypothetical protein [Frateuria aurantia]|uniref:hypothetical protein n=1 Tax=Frateuria aurantia TaxID=81475 RepID=UPI0012EA27F8|nr:hypothetical protein [Frateuria aurantia]
MDHNDDSVEYSDDAKFASSVFYEDVNDIDVYVEDGDLVTAGLIAGLINRALVDIRIETPISLGGRSEVIKRYEGDVPSNRSRLYILDGDYSSILCNMQRHVIPSGIFRL